MFEGVKMEEPFSSQEKSLVRDNCLQHIVALRTKASRLLTYLGLPSPWMGDVIAWRPYLERIFAVEMEERFIPDLVDRSYTLGLLHKISYYVGNIDNILQTGTDNYGRDLHEIFPIDIVNLDYCSGLVYEGFERIGAIESLFRNQARGLLNNRGKTFPYFLLFITHSSGHNDGKQKISKEYLTYLTREASIYQEAIRNKLETTIDWYLSDQCPPGYRHKVFIFGKVLEFAEARGFRVSPKAAIAYEGDHGKSMMHYQFEIYPENVGYPVPVNSRVNPIDILNWSVINVLGQDVAGTDRPSVDLT